MYNRAVKKVIVDAGHGGSDPGAVNGNIYEKDFNLQSAQYIFNRLRELGIPVEMTRNSDTSLPKNERIAKIKNLGIDPNVILVSNHINSGGVNSWNVIQCVTNKLNKIYYQDKQGNEYWHDKKIESKEATIEEQQEMQKLLETIYKED